MANAATASIVAVGTGKIYTATKSSTPLTETALTGTLAVTAGSVDVVGTGTQFATESPAGTGVKIAGITYYVLSTSSATAMKLTAAYAGTTATGLTVTKDVWTETFQTIKDTLKVTQADGTAVEVFIDQSDLPIYSSTKAGKISLTFQIPNTATAMLSMFFNTVSETATVASPMVIEGLSYEAVGMKMDLKDPGLMFRVAFGEQKQYWIFQNLSVSRKLISPTSTTAGAIEITADVTANPDPTKSDFIILNKVTT